MAKKRPTKAQREVAELRERVTNLMNARDAFSRQVDSLRADEDLHIRDLKAAREANWKQDRELHQAKLRPTQIRRVVRTVEYVGDPVEIATTLANSLPTGVNDRGQFAITVTLVEDATRDVIKRAEAARG